MHDQKRLVTFALVMMASILTLDYVMKATGLIPPPRPQAVAVPGGGPAAAGQGPAGGQDLAKAGTNPPAPWDPKAKADAPTVQTAAPPKVQEPAVALLSPEALVLGSSRPQGPEGFRMELQLDQKGAGIASLLSSQYEAEHEAGKKKGLPLPLLKYDPKAPASLALTLRDAKAVDHLATTPDAGEVPLDSVVWEVVKGEKGATVRKVSGSTPGAPGQPPKAVEGEELTFRADVSDLGVVVTKTYRLFPGQDGFELEVGLESAGATRSLVYRLQSPHGIPIEGEWYTGTFRDAVFGQFKGTVTEVVTLSAYDIAKRKENPENIQAQPLKFAGIETQYFAAFVEPYPVPPRAGAPGNIESAIPAVIHDDATDRQKSDIAIDLISKPVTVGPGTPIKHAYRVFAGPKTVEALAPYGAEELASYRKSNWIPGAPYLAKNVITPLLATIYGLTARVARVFGGKGGNYGVAIILLTMLVRLAMFPLSRKQAVSAKRMQDLQPLMKEIQAKYAEDKEAQTRETWALYKRHGVNPVGGCLPALIQLPIFVGLWQALNNSVLLRHAHFLYIENLAAPDMMFRFPTEIPFLGHYFNFLPFLVVALMLVQTKLFSPPPTTPEAEMQQKMMKYMMVFMAFMFYKVPSGLGLYFITSSLWQICERLLLPKVTASSGLALAGPEGGSPPAGGGGGGGGGRGPNNGPEKPPGKFSQFWEKVLAEASKNPTYRNLTDEKDKAANRSNSGGRERDRDRGGRGPDRGKPRTRPGRGGR